MRQLAWITLLVSAISLAVGIAIEGRWLWLIPLAGNTLIGLAINGRRIKSLWLFGQALIAALSGASPIPALFSVAFGLASWDLAAFSQLIDSMQQTFNLETFVRKHHFNLLLAIGSGSILAIASFALTMRLSFVFAGLIALLALAGIVFLSGRARSELSWRGTHRAKDGSSSRDG